MGSVQRNYFNRLLQFILHTSITPIRQLVQND
jgi:hypothetical protein